MRRCGEYCCLSAVMHTSRRQGALGGKQKTSRFRIEAEVKVRGRASGSLDISNATFLLVNSTKVGR